MKNKNLKSFINSTATHMAIIFLSGIMLAIFFEKSQKDLVITFIFFTIIFFIFLWATKNLIIGKKITTALKKGENKILEEISKSDNPIKVFLETKEFFNNKHLDDALNAYKNDINMMKEVSDEIEVDIKDYINSDLIALATNAHLVNQVSNTMTGLGILGTFIGLAIGLSSFNLTGNSDDIAKEIQPLMAGIKVAFHTSIYGLVYSIIFNFYYRHTLGNFELSVNNFIASFQKHIVKITNDGSEGSFIKYQKRLIDRFDKLIYYHSKALPLQESQATATEQMAENLTKQLTLVIQDTIVPEVLRVREAVEIFASEAKKDHNEGLKRIVDGFIEQMNENLGESFKNLSNILEETSEQQKRNIAFVENALNNLDNTTAGMSDVNNALKETMQHIEEYSKTVEDMQSIVNKNLMSLNLQTEENTKQAERQTEILESIQKLEETREENLAETSAKINKQAEKLDDIAQSINNKLENNFKAFTDNLEATLNQVTTASTEAIETLTLRSQENQNLLHEKHETFTQQLLNITNESKTQLENEYKAFMTSIEENNLEIFNLIKTNTNKLQKDLTTIISSFEEKVQDIEEASSIFNQGLIEELQTLTSDFNVISVNLAAINQDLTDNMSDAANKLDETILLLNNSLNDRIAGTFELFDKELSEISKHLAGTLKQIHFNVGKSKEIYDDMADSIVKQYEDIQNNLEQFLEYADKLHHNLEFKWKQLSELQDDNK